MTGWVNSVLSIRIEIDSNMDRMVAFGYAGLSSCVAGLNSLLFLRDAATAISPPTQDQTLVSTVVAMADLYVDMIFGCRVYPNAAKIKLCDVNTGTGVPPATLAESESLHMFSKNRCSKHYLFRFNFNGGGTDFYDGAFLLTLAAWFPLTSPQSPSLMDTTCRTDIHAVS